MLMGTNMAVTGHTSVDEYSTKDSNVYSCSVSPRYRPSTHPPQRGNEKKFRMEKLNGRLLMAQGIHAMLA